MKLEITSEAVLNAAKKNPESKSLLKNLFPKAFNLEYNDEKIYAFKGYGGCIYKLHKLSRNGSATTYGFIDMGGSSALANGEKIDPQDFLYDERVKQFNNAKEFIEWLYENK